MSLCPCTDADFSCPSCGDVPPPRQSCRIVGMLHPDHKQPFDGYGRCWACNQRILFKVLADKERGDSARTFKVVGFYQPDWWGTQDTPAAIAYANSRRQAG